MILYLDHYAQLGEVMTVPVAMLRSDLNLLSPGDTFTIFTSKPVKDRKVVAAGKVLDIHGATIDEVSHISRTVWRTA